MRVRGDDDAGLVLAELLELSPAGVEEKALDDGVEYVIYGAPGELPALPDVQAAAGDVLVDVTSEEIPDDWAERWRTYHRPVQVGRVWVGPGWERPPADAVGVVIDPGRAFGTGAHATTRLCLELLQEAPRGSMLDLGSGSGVLAVAAARLGFSPVTAIDSDPTAVEVTKQNAAANAVDVVALLADAAKAELPRADVVTANVTGEVVAALAGRLRAGRAITAGYLLPTEPVLPGFRRAERRSEEGWAADLWLAEE